MWTELVRVYESRLAVLEEARHAYASAMTEVVSLAADAMGLAVDESIENFGEELSRSGDPKAVSADAVFPGAPWPWASITDSTGPTELRFTLWVPSAFGGPVGILRLGLALQSVRPGLDHKEWTARCSELLPADAPGEPFDRLDTKTYSDMGPSEMLFRVVSVPLNDRQTGEVAREVREATLELAGHAISLFDPISDAGRPIEVVEETLLAYRPTLEARAAEAGAAVGPARSLGPWSGGRYLAVGNFWLASLPSMNALAACSNKADRDVVAALAEKLDRPAGSDSVVIVLTEEELRDPDVDCRAVISEAYDLWFSMKAGKD